MTPLPSVPVPYISAHSRARVVTILLLAGIILSALTSLGSVAEFLLPEFGEDQEIEDNPAGFGALMLVVLLGLLSVCAYIATVISFLMWLYRCASNLQAFGWWRSQIGHSPAWAVGSFFVPIISLFVPYRAVKEVWQKSEPANSVSFSFTEDRPGFFPAWWTFWLLCSFAGNAYFRMEFQGAQRDATLVVGILADVLSMAAAFFAIKVVKEIDRRQAEASQVIGSTMPGPPPPPEFHRTGDTSGSAGAQSNSATTGA